MTSTPTRPAPPTMRFGRLDIAFDHRVLRPRPWTAAQSRWAAQILEEAPEGPVLELCCGAGHIGLLTILGSDRRLVAVDVDEVACDFARTNAAAAGLTSQVEVRQGRMTDAVAAEESFPVIVADPPWVPSERTGDHPEDPLTAIDGGDDGLALARTCVDVARAHLADSGVMLLQLGTPEQASVLGREIEESAHSRRLRVTDVRRPHPTGVVARIEPA